MLQQLERLCTNTDGRYATDAELSFFQDYLRTARLRFSLYQKIQKLESKLVQKTLAQLKLTNPNLLMQGNVDMTAKCQRDTVLMLRYTAASLLIDDPDIFRDGVLIWLQTIMKSFKTENSYRETYRIIQIVIRQSLTPEEAKLFSPLLEMSRIFLEDA